MARVSLDGKWLAVDQRLCEMSGYSGSELLGKSLNSSFSLGLAQDAEYQRLLTGEVRTYAKEFKTTSKNGSALWLSTAFAVIRGGASNRPQSLLAVLEDITDRKQAEQARREIANRFIEAQEAERTRIARELHDDIGQTLAILRIQMMRSGQPVSGMPGRVHPNIVELGEKVKEIANKVSQISHQLHSSHLEYLGLKAAVQNVCDELGGKYHAKVTCVCEQIPAKVDGITGLCFLRVLQEAMHNIGKHSGAKNVEVRLTRSGDELSLVISDDGRGFDPEEARLAAGLGLISMRERVNLAGGHFDITSARGRGTRISARAPLVTAKESEMVAASR